MVSEQLCSQAPNLVEMALLPTPCNMATIATSLAFNILSFPPRKLTSDNYLLWKAQCLPLLQSYDLVGLIDGRDPCPP